MAVFIINRPTYHSWRNILWNESVCVCIDHSALCKTTYSTEQCAEKWNWTVAVPTSKRACCLSEFEFKRNSFNQFTSMEIVCRGQKDPNDIQWTQQTEQKETSVKAAERCVLKQHQTWIFKDKCYDQCIWLNMKCAYYTVCSIRFTVTWYVKTDDILIILWKHDRNKNSVAKIIAETVRKVCFYKPYTVK